MSIKTLPTPDYASWLTALKARIQSAQISAARAVKSELILLYWGFVRCIVERQQALGWGNSEVERLSADLQAKYP